MEIESVIPKDYEDRPATYMAKLCHIVDRMEGMVIFDGNEYNYELMDVFNEVTPKIKVRLAKVVIEIIKDELNKVSEYIEGMQDGKQ